MREAELDNLFLRFLAILTCYDFVSAYKIFKFYIDIPSLFRKNLKLLKQGVTQKVQINRRPPRESWGGTVSIEEWVKFRCKDRTQP
jgi:hypothetical protein